MKDEIIVTDALEIAPGEFGVRPFPCESLSDRIFKLLSTGIVEESVPITSAFDDNEGAFDPDSDIRSGRMEKYQAALDNEATRSYMNRLAHREQETQTPSPTPAPEPQIETSTE